MKTKRILKVRNVIPLIFLIMLVGSCASGTPSGNLRSGAWSAQEQKETSVFMVNSLYDYLKGKKTPALLEFAALQNRSMRHIDLRSLADDMMLQLSAKKIRFIDREKRKDALSEIELSQAGVIDEKDAIPVGKLKSPNYILEGAITESSRIENGEKITNLAVSFKLVKVASTEIVWQNQKNFETKKSAEKYSW